MVPPDRLDAGIPSPMCGPAACSSLSSDYKCHRPSEASSLLPFFSPNRGMPLPSTRSADHVAPPIIDSFRPTNRHTLMLLLPQVSQWSAEPFALTAASCDRRPPPQVRAALLASCRRCMSHPIFSQNRMLVVFVPKNQVYTHTIQIMDIK
jgi:hypothetical protein